MVKVKILECCFYEKRRPQQRIAFYFCSGEPGGRKGTQCALSSREWSKRAGKLFLAAGSDLGCPCRGVVIDGKEINTAKVGQRLIGDLAFDDLHIGA